MILSGDIIQLAPDLISEEAIKGGLGISLFEKLSAKYPGSTNLLIMQYRMNNTVMALISESLYQSKLKADDSISLSSLKKKKKIALEKIKDEITNTRKIIDRNLLVIDTNGLQLGECSNGEGAKYNIS